MRFQQRGKFINVQGYVVYTPLSIVHSTIVLLVSMQFQCIVYFFNIYLEIQHCSGLLFPAGQGPSHGHRLGSKWTLATASVIA